MTYSTALKRIVPVLLILAIVPTAAQATMNITSFNEETEATLQFNVSNDPDAFFTLEFNNTQNNLVEIAEVSTDSNGVGTVNATFPSQNALQDSDGLYTINLVNSGGDIVESRAFQYGLYYRYFDLFSGQNLNTEHWNQISGTATETSDGVLRLDATESIQLNGTNTFNVFEMADRYLTVEFKMVDASAGTNALLRRCAGGSDSACVAIDGALEDHVGSTFRLDFYEDLEDSNDKVDVFIDDELDATIDMTSEGFTNRDLITFQESGGAGDFYEIDNFVVYARPTNMSRVTTRPNGTVYGAVGVDEADWTTSEFSHDNTGSPSATFRTSDDGVTFGNLQLYEDLSNSSFLASNIELSGSSTADTTMNFFKGEYGVVPTSDDLRLISPADGASLITQFPDFTVEVSDTRAGTLRVCIDTLSDCGNAVTTTVSAGDDPVNVTLDFGNRPFLNETHTWHAEFIPDDGSATLESSSAEFTVLPFDFFYTLQSPQDNTVVKSSDADDLEIVYRLETDIQGRARTFQNGLQQFSTLTNTGGLPAFIVDDLGNTTVGTHTVNGNLTAEPAGISSSANPVVSTQTRTLTIVDDSDVEANITLFNPTDGEQINDTQVTFTYEVERNVSGSVNLFVDNELRVQNSVNSGTSNVTNTLEFQPDSAHSWTVTFTSDDTGLEYAAGETRTFGIEAPPVQVFLKEPADNAIIESSPVSFKITVTNRDGGLLDILLDGEVVEDAQTTITPSTGDQFRNQTVVITLSGLEPGKHSWSARYDDNSLDDDVVSETRSFEILSDNPAEAEDQPGTGGGEIIEPESDSLLGTVLTPFADILGITLATALIMFSAVLSIAGGAAVARETNGTFGGLVMAGLMMSFSFIGWMPAFIGVAVAILALVILANKIKFGGE